MAKNEKIKNKPENIGKQRKQEKMAKNEEKITGKWQKNGEKKVKYAEKIGGNNQKLREKKRGER